MSDYTPKVDDVVVRRDRDLGEWGGGPHGLTAYRVACASPTGARVTLYRVDDAALVSPLVLRGGAVRALRPLTPEDRAEMEADSSWLLARRRAVGLEEWLRSWRRTRPADLEVERFLEDTEALWKRKEGP